MNPLLFRAVVLAGASAVAVNATVFDLNLIGRAVNGLLTGSNEEPQNNSPAQGGELSDFFGGPGLQYDDSNRQLAVRIAFGSTGIGYAADLQGTFTMAHIHGPADVNNTAGVLHDLTGDVSLQSGNRSGTIATFVTLSPTEEQQLFQNLLYINIHSSAFPSGEIRANLTPVPEPQTYALVAGAALLGFAAYRRRQATLAS